MDHRSRHALAASLIAALSTACPPPERGVDDAGTPAAGNSITWKPGAKVLFEPTEADPAVTVLDALRDGSRVLVLFSHGGNVRLAVSDDLGASFRTVELDLPATAKAPFPLHAWSGRVFVFVRGLGTSPAVPYWQVMEVDLTSGHHTAVGKDPLAWGRLFPRDGVVTSFSPGGGSAPVATSGRLDLTTGALDLRSKPYALSSSLCLGEQWVSLDGQSFTSRCEVALPEPGLCLLQATATSPAPSGACFPRGFYPAFALGFLRPLPGGGLREIFWLSSAAPSDIFATTLTPGTPPAVSQPVFLAHSKAGDPLSLYIDREAMGGLFPIVTDEITPTERLVSFDGVAASEVPLSHTVCSDDARCFTATPSNALPGPYGTMVRAVPLGANDWLTIHTVRDDLARPNRSYTALGPWDYLVALRETVAPRPISDPAPAPTSSPLPGFPGSVAGSALEGVCARMVACFSNAQWPTGGKIDLRACVENWLYVSAGNPAADGAYQRFLATPPGDCAAFHDTWPDVLRPRVDTCGCHGDVAVTCPNGQGGPALDCRARGLSCILDPSGRATCAAPYTTAPACDTCDAAHRATYCLAGSPPYVFQTDCPALGLACAAAPNGRPICTATTPTCSAADVSRCDGNLSYTCLAALVGTRQDCARTGQTCAPTLGCVTQPALPPGCAVPGEQCQGRYLTYCLGGRTTGQGDGPVRYLDCAALGYRTCAMKTDPVAPHAACVP